ncbi:PPOX class F420-dependent oxidoreductase [Candidatus Nitrosotenuis uzonensis]|uniref:Putative Pyridoxamine 5'-phosphate oxidase n=1 Tax=Candidatus Nitrosotenuis uzonensis TaxID=1407055 RepID=A0A812F456_9ARCH|nr:PPOX class F420-dependent oxidoreductase [Candidatus Nitrosotenuis uzonensis]CAE6496066.1 putative Pyridoxamine 5'-phosphate oxidase [Candidatus Nitrosotenuis uzonensis]
MSSDKIAKLQDHKYINLETYKKNGQAVRTPVWFVVFDEQIFVMTTKNTGKVKRIRNNQDVKIMPCGMRGEPKGEWVTAKARFANESETQKAIQLRHKKYGFRAKLVGMFVKKDEPVVIAITI